MESPHLILEWIRTRISSERPHVVGIDGPGGTGKTTLAMRLQALDPTVTLVHMDDFDLPDNGKSIGDPAKKEIGADTDWRRLLAEVIVPLRAGEKSRYRPFDRETGKFGEYQTVVPFGIILIEGVFSLRKELFPYVDIGIWLTCPLPVRLERALERDGEQMRSRWENDWIPMEERYIAEHKPQAYAQKVIDTGEELFVL